MERLHVSNCSKKSIRDYQEFLPSRSASGMWGKYCDGSDWESQRFGIFPVPLGSPHACRSHARALTRNPSQPLSYLHPSRPQSSAINLHDTLDPRSRPTILHFTFDTLKLDVLSVNKLTRTNPFDDTNYKIKDHKRS